ncbi:MAG: hypothetical protein Q7S43_05230 [bacterium]|nr:hypothetical protein [bacterium]
MNNQQTEIARIETFLNSTWWWLATGKRPMTAPRSMKRSNSSTYVEYSELLETGSTRVIDPIKNPICSAEGVLDRILSPAQAEFLSKTPSELLTHDGFLVPLISSFVTRFVLTFEFDRLQIVEGTLAWF